MKGNEIDWIGVEVNCVERSVMKKSGEERREIKWSRVQWNEMKLEWRGVI